MEEQATSPLYCTSCHAENVRTAAFCKSCNFPFWGADSEKMGFYEGREHADARIITLKKRVKYGVNTLNFSGAFCSVVGLFWYFFSEKEQGTEDAAFLAIILCLIFSFVLFALSFWSKTKAVPALISAAALYILLTVYEFINNSPGLASSVIFYSLMLFFVIRGLNAALEIEKLNKKYNIS